MTLQTYLRRRKDKRVKHEQIVKEREAFIHQHLSQNQIDMLEKEGFNANQFQDLINKDFTYEEMLSAAKRDQDIKKGSALIDKLVTFYICLFS